jgi:FeS assembly protein IscX
MKRKLTWVDVEDLGIALADRFPDTDPLTVRFTDLHRWVREIELFEDDPAASNEKKLEAIQMAWYEEWQDRHS